MKKSEKILAMLFFALLFAGANFILAIRVINKQKSQEAKLHEIEMEKVVVKDFLEMKEEIFQYRDWLDENQPVFSAKADSERDILKLANSAADYDVSILSRVLLDIEELPHAVQSSIVLKTRGELNNVMKWLFYLQKPDLFRVIRNFKMIPDKEDRNIVNCDFTLMIWHQRKNSESE